MALRVLYMDNYESDAWECAGVAKKVLWKGALAVSCQNCLAGSAAMALHSLSFSKGQGAGWERKILILLLAHGSHGALAIQNSE